MYTYIYTVYIYIRILSTINPESLSLVYTYIYICNKKCFTHRIEPSNHNACVFIAICV